MRVHRLIHISLQMWHVLGDKYWEIITGRQTLEGRSEQAVGVTKRRVYRWAVRPGGSAARVCSCQLQLPRECAARGDLH